MYVKYGDFSFLGEEAGLSTRCEFVHSKRGFKKYQRVRYDIFGELCIPSGQYDITSRLNEIISAFSEDDKDIGLFHDDGTPSQHFTSTTLNNLTGNQVIAKQFPVTDKGEYTSGRQFQITVSALLLDPSSSLIEHQDVLMRQGNAGPLYQWKRNIFWSHYPEIVAPSTVQVMAHEGYRVGITGWPLPVTPFYEPPFEQNHIRRVTHHSPVRHPKGYTEYKTSWSYRYVLPVFDDISRPTLA